MFLEQYSKVLCSSLLPQQGLESRGVSCVHHELTDEDHFTVVERMSEGDYKLNKVRQTSVEYAAARSGCHGNRLISTFFRSNYCLGMIAAKEFGADWQGHDPPSSVGGTHISPCSN